MSERPTRIAQLEALYQANPQNLLATYGLAMEYMKIGEHDQAISCFDRVLTIDPLYGAAYYHKGKALEKQQRFPEAMEVYRHGIEQMRIKGDQHTLSEIQHALEAIE